MADTTKPAGQSAETKPTSVAELTTAFPDLVASIQRDAATAERDRITGIEKVAGRRKGIDQLVAAMKADATCTPDTAARRILEHENSQLDAQHANIKGVESVTGQINAAPSAGGEAEQQQEANTPEGWKAEFEKSAANSDLRRDFATADAYVHFKQGEADGRIRRLVAR